jgi:hypothetical protein
LVGAGFLVADARAAARAAIKRHWKALDLAESILGADEGLGAVLGAARDKEDSASDADIAAFCRRIAREAPDGGTKAWLSRLADALEECDRAGDECDRAGDELERQDSDGQ